MRKTGITIILTVTALAGLALAGLTQATAAPAGRTITKDFTAVDAGSNPSLSGHGWQMLAVDLMQNSAQVAKTRLRAQVVEMRKGLNARPGVTSVKTKCDGMKFDANGPYFSASPGAILGPLFPVPGTWAWDVRVDQTCTFVLTR